jgi:PAS domain S-box-containing protein
MNKASDQAEVDKGELFYAGQTRILEMVATGSPLSDILTSIVVLMEAQAEGMLCSILLLHADGKHVRHAAAPSLPEAYVKAVDGAPIGPRNGSCGTAMFFKKPVVVTDVMTDPLWADYRQLAEICGLRSCWSTPILSVHGKVLGSFAMYRQETRGPNAEEQGLAQIATHITGIAIERKHAEEALHHSEEQLSLLQTITMEVATASDLSSALKVVLQRVCEKTGWDFAQSWLPRPGGMLLELGPVWLGNSAELENFRAISTQTNFAPGEGLPGRVWRAKYPIWVEDVRNDLNFPRAKTATECGLRAALGIPILARDEVIAVLEFFLRAPRHEDVRLVNVIVAVAAQLGLAIERKRAEEAVREREAQISVAAESADVAFWVLYPEQNTAWMSEKGRKIYGFHPHETLTRDSLVNRAHPDDRAGIESVLNRACHSFEAFESEHRLVLPFGKKHWVIMRGRCFKDEKGKLAEIIGVTIDVSVQKQSALQMQTHREEIAHLNRVALMGEMTASVAHELNQPLTAIANTASAARRFLERGNIDPVLLKRLLQDMVTDSQRAGEVIRGIRALVRKEKGVRSLLSLNAIVADTLRFVGQDVLLRESVITTELDHSLPQVEAVPVQMQQVLINLIMNALDAVEKLPPSERRIIISTRTGEDGLAEVSVRDFGHGLPEDRPGKVFEHFFSTKQAGMGMGLTIVRSIIETHGGTISAENAPDRGARFFFRLPAASRSQQTQAA